MKASQDSRYLSLAMQVSSDLEVLSLVLCDDEFSSDSELLSLAFQAS